MRNIFLVGLILMLSSFCLEAQQINPGRDSHAAAAANGQQATMQGCMQNSADRYTIRDDNGIVHVLSGDARTLSYYVGHEVQVSGTRLTKTRDAATQAAASSATELPDFRVEHVKDISDTCSGH